MADSRLTDLASITAAGSSDLLYVVQAGISKKIAVSSLTSSILATKFVAAPATTTSTGTIGQLAIDSSNVYVCVATNTWKRAALTDW